jgi:endonuclease YncB( thermonuclease family)
VRLASITLAAALCAGSIPCASHDGERPSVRNVSPPKVIRTHRPRITDDFFKQDAVRFERARIDMNGSILADGHNLNLYGVGLVRRDKICTAPEGARWACGQRAFIALPSLLEGKSITCRFKHVTVPPKAICWVGDSDVTHLLLSQGWAELADEVTEANYVEALASAQSKKAGIWGDARREPLLERFRTQCARDGVLFRTADTQRVSVKSLKSSSPTRGRGGVREAGRRHRTRPSVAQPAPDTTLVEAIKPQMRTLGELPHYSALQGGLG